MDGNVVGVSFDAEIAGDRGEDGANAVKGVHGIGAQGCRSALEESDFAKTEDDALAGITEGDGAVLELFGESEFELAADGFGALARGWQIGSDGGWL